MAFQDDESRINRLQQMLEEDAPEDAETLTPEMMRLLEWKTPAALPTQTAQLLDALNTEFPTPRSRFQCLLEWWPLLLMRSQISIIQREIWAASAVVLLLGVGVTLLVYPVSAGTLTPLAVVAPVVAAIGLALLYDTDVEQLLELEDATPASSRLLLLARLTLIYSFDLIICLLGSLLLALFHAEILLLPLVLSWLAPMALLSALAFFLSVVSRNSTFGAVMALILWGLHVLMSEIPQPTQFIQALSLPGFSEPSVQPYLIVLAVALVALATYLVEHRERGLVRA